MDTNLVPVSAVIATKDRSVSLRRTLESLARQSAQPTEIIIVDASANDETRVLCEQVITSLRSRLRWKKASQPGAASQRNEGVPLCNETVIWFFDDDIRFEDECASRLWVGLRSDPHLGGVNAMIVNQHYGSPGRVSRWMFGFLNGAKQPSYAGKIIGPAVNLLPKDRPELPEVVPVEWLNTTCTMYRQEALPTPAFDAFFDGYSLMEDVALSLRIGQRGWKLANARTARIFHDSQSGQHKSDVREASRMGLTNRHFVMTKVMGRTSSSDYARLVAWELFSFASVAANPRCWKILPAIFSGKLAATSGLLRGRPRA